MRLTTVTLEAIEMTREEESDLWTAWGTGQEPTVEGKRIDNWDRNDGDNDILLEGENVYRMIVRKGN